jgi:hypothetical protein
MLFLSLFMDLLMMFAGPGAFSAADTGVVDQGVPEGVHRVHGHLPGPPDGHNGDSHVHHGQHGHNVGPSGTAGHLPAGHHA